MIAHLVERLRRRWLAGDASIVAEGALVIWFAAAAWRLQWIADDGYIYLTYVQNWTELGAGPTFVSGERVEGYTSSLWFVTLSIVDLFRPDGLLSREQATVLLSLAVSVAAATTWLAVERAAVRSSVRTHVPGVVLNVPLALFAAGEVFQTFATSGLETPLLMAWVLLVAWAIWSPRLSTLALAALAGLGPLVRPELAVVSIALIGLIALAERGRRRQGEPLSARRLGALGALVVVPGVASEVVRIGYYGQLVPNTYYAKTGTGHGWADGWRYFQDTAIPHGVWWVVAASVSTVGVTLFVALRSGRVADHAPALWRRVFLLGLAFVSAVPVLRVGGDFMHGRTLIPAWLFLLASLAGAGTQAIEGLRARWPSEASVSRRSLAAACALVVVALAQHTTTSRQHASGELIIGGIADEMRFYEARDPQMHDFGGTNQNPLAIAGRDLAALAARLDTEIGAAVGSIGMPAYFGQHDGAAVYIHDVLGLTDPLIARLPRGGPTRVGHARWSPDVVIALDDRVDVASLDFPGYDEAFGFTVGTSRFVLVNFDLVEPLLDAGVLGDTDVTRMDRYLVDRLEGPVEAIDPDFVTFLTWRYRGDDAIEGRIRELRELHETSSWTSWSARTADERALLDARGCRDRWHRCLADAVRRHRASPAPFGSDG
ncbi:MAG: hypothetical protein HKN41_09285 [Ilumatobacter sp.]|nr:hypothetical protein [Ilumatobacter sp.]